MWLLLIEVLLVLGLLAGAVWWTMFSGRPRGESTDRTTDRTTDDMTGRAGDGRDPPLR